MGTMIQSYHLREDDFRGTFTKLSAQQAGNNDLLCLTRPDIIADIHRRYLAAGADIITTNTFNAQRISLADYGCAHLVRDINLAAAHIARAAVAAHSADSSASFTSSTSTPAPKFSDPVSPIPTPHDTPVSGASAPISHASFVVGSIGPTNKSLSMSPDISDPALRAITFDEMVDAYVEQMTALLEGGVDALLIETIFDTLNAKAAIYAADEAMRHAQRRVPLMLSITISDRAGRLLNGQTLEAFFVSVLHAAPLTIGLNCSFGAEEMLPHLRLLRSLVNRHNLRAHEHIYISAYPNAGLPNQMGLYDETPERMAAHIRPFLEEKLVDIIGGCCGTTDLHIRAIKEEISTIEEIDKTGSAVCIDHLTHSETQEGPFPSLSLSGLEPLLLTPEVGFINVGERCNVAGSRKFLRLIREKQYDEAVEIARQQVEDGALVLDINMDDGLLDTAEEIQHFLRLLAAEPDVCRVPFMVDSSKWDVIRAALGCIPGKAIVNSISLKEGEDIFLDHARELHRMGAAVIVMAFDEEGQATTYERRTSVCARAYRLLTEQAGFLPEDIIFDPNVLAIATGMPEHDRYALDFIRATGWIHQNLPGAHISGGVSNLSFAFRGNNELREAMHAVFLYHARHAGMDMAILNPATRVTYADIPADQLTIIEDAILARRPDACERLTDLATAQAEQEVPARRTSAPGSTSAPVPEPSGSVSPASSLSSRLITALRRGTTDTLEADLAEALQVYPTPVAIIEGPLMEGMNLVGKLFGEGKMFLPQVVKTARTMKRAVEILQPAIEAARNTPPTRPTPSPSRQGGEKAGAQLSSDSEALPLTGERGEGLSPATPCILVATVKGDVHDIGKNIVATVMACNGYNVIDLGVMVPAEAIVHEALERKPDVIGLSGLITPSLEEMVRTVHLLDQAGIHVPVLIGGATTSKLHTALRIAPVYSGPVIHVRDASQNAPLVAPFLNPATANEARAQLSAEQEALRAAHAQPSTPLTSLEEARANKPRFFEE